MVSLRKKKKDDIIALKRLRINLVKIDLPNNEKTQNIYSLKEFKEILPAFEKSLNNPINGASSLKNEEII
jgi:hypothetical protein